MSNTINTGGAYRNVREARDLIYHAHQRLLDDRTIVPPEIAMRVGRLVEVLGFWLGESERSDKIDQVEK